MDIFAPEKSHIESRFSGTIRGKRKKKNSYFQAQSNWSKSIVKNIIIYSLDQHILHDEEIICKKEIKKGNQHEKKPNNFLSFSSLEHVNIIDFQNLQSPLPGIISAHLEKDNYIETIIQKLEYFIQESDVKDKQILQFLENITTEIHFNKLSEKWKQSIELFSFANQVYTQEDYLKIIEMGNKALPYILKDLKKTHDYWFYALVKITGENPVKEEDNGNSEKMTMSWLEWAKSKNIAL